MRKKGLAIALLAVFVVSSFVVLFSLSAYNGTLSELNSMRKEIYTAPVIKVEFLSKQENRITERYNKILNDPNKILLIMARELTIDSFVDIKSFKQESQGPLIPERIVDSASLNRFVKNTSVKSAFISDVILDSQFLRLNGKVVKFMPLPKNFLNGLNLALACGRLPIHSNEVVLTYRAARLFPDAKSLIGKTIVGTDPVKSEAFKGASFTDKYVITGVLKKLPDAFYYSTFGEVGGFGILPNNYVPLAERSGSAYINNKIFFTTEKLFILPERGKDVVKQVGIFLQNFKLEKEGIIPKIFTEYKTLATIFSIDSVRRKLRYLILIGMLVSLLSMFVAAVFANLVVELKRVEFAVKRAIGSRIKDIFNELFAKYAIYIFFSIIIGSFLIIVFKNNLSLINTGSSIKFLVPVSLSLRSHVICLSWWVIVLSTLIMLSIFGLSIRLPLRVLGRYPPFSPFLLRNKEYSRNNEKIIAAIIAIVVSVLLFSGSIKNYTQRKISESEKVVNPDIIRIVPSKTYLSGDKIIRFVIGAPRYSFNDYVALRNYLKGKAMVDFRNTTPTTDPETGIRYVEATPGAFKIFNLKMKSGRFIEESDLGQKVCVLGNTVSDKYNLSCGKFIKLRVFNNQTNLYKVIGVLKSSNYLINNSIFYAASSGGLSNEWNSSIKEYVGRGMFLIKPLNSKNAKNIAEESLKFLYERHPDKNNGVIINVKKLTDKVRVLFTSLYTLLSLFTFLALLSSFLSLSALLFIEVIRRTREIGIKKAIGATRKDITKEFTLNGLKITTVALAIGIPIGILISLIIEKLKGWNYYIPINILIFVILISLLLGFLFSFLPAYFASKINPAYAVKSE